MGTSLIVKALVILILIAIVYFLFSGLYYLIRDRGESERTVRSLTARIAISVTLFVLLIIGFATGLIKPHGLPTVETGQSAP